MDKNSIGTKKNEQKQQTLQIRAYHLIVCYLLLLRFGVQQWLNARNIQNFTEKIPEIFPR